MRAYAAFTGKEFLENWRTYKLFILTMVFLILGMMSPLFAKYTNEIIVLAAPEMNLQLPEPTMYDSWVQFFSNVGQIGLIALVITFSGIIARELSRGTLINMLTKGLSRSTVILSKFTAATVIWTVCYLCSLAVAYVYTAYFWAMDGMNNVFLSFFGLWLFGVFLISLVILGGVLFKGVMGSLLFTGGALVIIGMTSWIPVIGDYEPAGLPSWSMSLLFDIIELSEYMPRLITCGVLVIASIAAAIMLLNKKSV
jgi:ABC-2 type transport system permease protein